MKFATPATASEPYRAVAPSFKISMRSNAIIGGSDDVSTKFSPRSVVDRALRLAAAVQQHQRGADAEAAQVDVARARREVLRERVGVVLRARVDREVLEHAADVVGARGREVVARDAHERRRRVELRRPPDVGAGDDDLFDLVLRRRRQRAISGDHGRGEQAERGRGKH